MQKVLTLSEEDKKRLSGQIASIIYEEGMNAGSVKEICEDTADRIIRLITGTSYTWEE